MTERPGLEPGLPPEEFDRWYWTVAELRVGARSLGVGTSGRKAELEARVRAALAGEDPPERSTPSPRDTLDAVLTPETVVHPPQRLTRALRTFMEEHCGPGFRFDRHMRELFGSGSGRSDLRLADAVDVWFRTRDEPADVIDPVFEYNRFVRDWRSTHPGAAHAEVVAAWRAHRSAPRDRPARSHHPRPGGPRWARGRLRR